MDTDGLLFLFNFFLFVGVLIAFKDRGLINRLRQKVSYLEKMLDLQTTRIEDLSRKVKDLTPPTTEEELAKKASLIEGIRDRLDSESDADGVKTSDPEKTRFDSSPDPTTSAVPDNNANQSSPSSETPDERTAPAISDKIASQQGVSQSVLAPQSLPEPPSAQEQPTQPAFNIEDLLKGNGIFWLAAVVLAIGGVFLAKYAIEAGLLPPSVRVILGALFGISLVVCAEVVNRFKEKLKVNTPYIPAALASGGVITCFAMALVSFDFYHFITPNFAFVLLALISLAATWLTLRFGPVLAGIGIIGSYSVPALVSTGSNNMVALLVYVFFVSLSAVWVAEYVKQKWLWWQSFTGHFAWFVVAAIVVGGTSNFGIVLLFAIASLYLYVLVGLLGWKLTQTMTVALSVKALLMPRKEQAVILFTLSVCALHLFFNNEFSHLIWASLSLSAVVMWVSYRHSALDSWPYLMLAFALFAFYRMPDSVDFTDNLFPFTGKYLFVQLAVMVTMAFSLFMTMLHSSRHAYLLLLVIAPVCLYGISYVTSTPQAEIYLYPVWAAEMLMIAAIASVGAMKTSVNTQQVAFLVLTNAMLTLCSTMLLSASTLTLALVAQVASMSYLSWKYSVRIPDWLYKVALLVVVTRLTFAPWLADYKDETILGVHWTLMVYPVVLAIIWFATKYNPSRALNAWFMGVFIHVVALLVTTETSYVLTGDYLNLFNLSYQEAILLSMNWLALSVVYLWRSRLAQSMIRLYQAGGILLLTGAALIHLDISLFSNPFFKRYYVGEGLVNWTVLQWLVPAILLYLLVRFKLLDRQFHPAIYAVVAALGFLFINGEIRNLFNNGYLLWETPIQQAELYSYSIVWLVISTTTIFAGQHLNHKQIISTGFIALALVILKAFGIDMAHLEGLFRALSFIGLGLCLVGIGWLFQKMQVKAEPADPHVKG